MAEAPSRTQRRHVREKATIDHLVQEVYEPKTPDEKHTERSPTTSTGLPVQTFPKAWPVPQQLLAEYIKAWVARRGDDHQNQSRERIGLF
jgi:hypothetical protein